MKKNLLFLSIFILFASCSIDDGPNECESTTHHNSRRSEKEIRELALSAVEMFSSDAKTKSNSKSIISIIPNSEATKSSERNLLFYTVNFDDGFAIIGAKAHLPEIIAYSDKGYYDGSDSEIEAFNIYLQDIKNSLSRIEPKGIVDVPVIDYLETVNTNTTETNEPLISVSWHQGQPFNWYCSSPFNADIPAGCVAVAIAQIMSVYSHPTSISLSYPYATQSSIQLNWNDMKDSSHYSSTHTYSCSGCVQLAALLREIGQRVNMSYGVGGSGASSTLSRGALLSFGYNASSYDNYSLTPVMNSLNANRPVYIRAQNNASSGHAWVVDGSQYICNKKTTYLVSKTSRRIVAEEYVKKWYLNFNYGWGGINDGYYLAAWREHGSGEIIVGGSYDDWRVSMFTGANGYNLDVKIITNIYK